jgi:hypothetical protein
MKNSHIITRTMLLAAIVACATASLPALAAVGSTTDPGGTTTEIGARIRWGASGFEASVFDASPFDQNPTLNPSGAPVWTLNTPYKFQVTFNQLSGELALGVDFNGDSSFAAAESISRTLFTAPTSYAGQGFKYLSISGNESSSTARSNVSNLVINGVSQSAITPNGNFLETFYADGTNVLAPITITGALTFTTSGTAQERPSWNFNFKNVSPVPEPETYAMLMAGLGLLGFAARRRKLA